MKEQAGLLVREFVDEMLSGDWDKFRTFDFKTLAESEKFGCQNRNFDCDDTNLMRAIYVVLWGDSLPFLTLDNFGYQRQYRGDTINTFHTMFGREIPGRKGFFAGLEKYSPSEELREKVREFSTLCRNLGNYMVLPNYYAEQTTLNCYRGTNDWHDFFDRFLIELHKVLTGAEPQDPILRNLVRVNGYCFRKFAGEAGFRNFCKEMLLESYCDPEGAPKTVFSMNFHWKNEKDPEQYDQDAELYLQKTREIICSRADRMISLLKQKLSGDAE